MKSQSAEKSAQSPAAVHKQEVAAAFAEALAASKLRLKDQLLKIVTSKPEVVVEQDAEGRTCLHYAAEHCEGVEELLAVSDVKCCLEDRRGNVPLHFAASANCPMAAYAIAKSCPQSCLARNKAGKTPADLAKASNLGEVLNAMLLACCSNEANTKDSCNAALQAIEALLDAGAVPDTWAPNGNSALMMAASADSPATIALLLKKNAQINMKDTLGRTALMFAAGNDSRDALVALMDAGGQQALSLQDNRGNNVLKYACGDEVKQLVQRRFAELEAAANANEAALLAVLEAEEQTAASAKQKRAHRGKKKKKGSKTQGVNGAAGDDSLSPDQLDADRGADCSCNSVPGTDSSEATEDAPEAAEHAVITPVCVEELQLERMEAFGVYGRAGKAEDHDAAKAVVAEVISINADASSPQERTEPTPKEGSTAYSSAVESLHCAKEPSPDSQPDLPASTIQCHSCGPAESRGSAVSHAAEGSQVEEGKPVDTERESGAAESASLVEFTQADRDAIATALRDEDACGKEAEQIWQEVRKPHRSVHGKPPLARRSSDKFFDAAHSLLPSSSSASLDSLGDSAASVASARSFPSGMLQVVQQAAGPQQHPGLGTPGSVAHAPAARQLDPQVQAPGPGHTPVAMPAAPRGTALAKPAISWASVVQGTATSLLGDSISVPDLAVPDLADLGGGGGSAAQDTGRPAAPEGEQEDPEAVGQPQRPFTASKDRPSLDCCSPTLQRTTGEAALPQPGVCASPGTSWAGNPPGGSTASAQSTAELREENAELCQRLLQSEASRLQLEQQFQAALVSLQQEHRLLLQKAVEDTAKNLLQQEQQRYGWQIEALQQLLLQARQQLQSQQQASLRAPTASGALKGSAGGAPSAALAAKLAGPAGQAAQLLSAAPQSFLSPQQMLRRSSLRTGSLVRPNSPSAPLSIRGALPSSPRPAAQSCSPRLSSGSDLANRAKAPFSSATTAQGNFQDQQQQWGTSGRTIQAAPNPWRTTSEGAIAKPASFCLTTSEAAFKPASDPWKAVPAAEDAAAKPVQRPVLPSLDSIWGPAASAPQAVLQPSSSGRASPMVRSLTGEFLGGAGTAFLTPASASSL